VRLRSPLAQNRCPTPYFREATQWLRPAPSALSAAGPRAGAYVTYGTSVVELRAMLRRKFGKVTFIEPWKATS